MRSLTVIALTLLVCLSLPVAAEDNPQKLPKGVEEFLKSYYTIKSNEDVDGYKKLIHPNGFSSVPFAATIEAWKKNDPHSTVTVTKIELLHSEPDMVILRVHTRTHFPEYPLDTVESSLVALRKVTDNWRLWHDSILDRRKDG